MASTNCYDRWTITSQDDVDDYSDRCQGVESSDDFIIYLEDATGNITFPNKITATKVVVTGSRDLQSLNLTSCDGVNSIELDDIPNLRELYLPAQASDATSNVASDIRISTQEQPLPGDTLIIYGGSRVSNLTVDNYTDGTVRVRNITDIARLNLSNSHVTFSGPVGFSELLQFEGFMPSLSILTGVQDVVATNVSYNELDYWSTPIQGDFTITGAYSNPIYAGTGSPESLQIPIIGGSVAIYEASSASLVFSNLTTIGGDLIVANNTDSVISFKRLTKVSTISMRGNTNTRIPGSMESLETADEIHLKGVIDTSSGSNIFPSLKQVQGSVTVEAENEDFDCSSLVDQMNKGIINSLVCNGTGNSTSNNTDVSNSTTATSSSSSLPTGARVGIGVSIAVVFIALIMAFAYFRRRKKALSQQRPEFSPDAMPPQLLYSNEIMEVEDNKLLEMDGNRPVEVAGDEPFFQPSTALKVKNAHPVELDANSSRAELG